MPHLSTISIFSLHTKEAETIGLFNWMQGILGIDTTGLGNDSGTSHGDCSINPATGLPMISNDCSSPDSSRTTPAVTGTLVVRAAKGKCVRVDGIVTKPVH